METNTELLFSFLDGHSARISEKEELLYLEALFETLKAWAEGTISPEAEEATKEEVRKAIQLAVLKGMKANAQPHHQMTPDSIGLLAGYLADRLSKGSRYVTLFDPAAGTGNLLFTVMNYMDGRTAASAVEIDDLLIRISAVTADLLAQPVTLYHQDALRPLMVDPVDVVISDLPVGYYPDDENAAGFKLKADEGHSYAHHLFIEQSMRHLKKGGHGIFIVPANLFESQFATQLHTFLKEEAQIVAVLALPPGLFKSQAHAKSVLVLKKPDLAGGPKPEVLLANAPDMTNIRALESFFAKVDAWAEENGYKTDSN
ncbi:class I SAM-dependent methyltransferase [Edaphobacillus lindanitolerans]|uniref:Site-specific DNA-methyltransferase (Adenine-specific) n=1 Tax=Edaphobacillus lindanitolerans TaxID=550447 RepID=A0A1U7PQT5_9BACI|nr:class I SAM-dependent methyltransferase [Edaphobacillus lindanitolerans]SIT85157.1 site-specific DNA-methyltransferase (adenine-specific) [Edaphobacillus lindanitolerans]